MKFIKFSALPATEVLTMSSIEMVSYINSTRKAGEAEIRHADFLAKVPKVLNGGERNFSSSYQSAQNKSLPMYNFPRREAVLMGMSYSYELQAQIFDAWETAESTMSKAKAIPLIPNFDNPLEAARGWIVEHEARLALTSEIAIAKPKIAFHDAVVADSTTYSLRDAAKVLNQPPLKFNRWLRDEKFVMANNVAYEYFKNMGVLVSQYAGFVKADGTVAPATTRVTSKGIAYFQKQLASQGMCQ